MSVLTRSVAFARHRPIELGFGVLLIALGIQTLLKRQSEWNEVFVEAGRQLLAGEDIYAPNSPYSYPPFMALLAAPFSWVPPIVSRAAWFVASVVAMVAMLRAAWSIAGGRPISEFVRWPRSEQVAAAVGLGCGLTFTLNSFAHQQIDVIIGGLVMVGCLRMVTGRFSAGGSWVGLAASFKATPLLFAPYLALRRQFVGAFLVVIVMVGVNLLPDLIASAPQGGTWLERWLRRFVVTSQSIQTPLGAWGSEIIYNQSLGGTVQRLINTVIVPEGSRLVVSARPLVDPVSLKLAYYSGAALLAAFSIAVAARAALRAPTSSIGIECSLVIIFMLLLSPMSGAAHFGTLVLPGFCLARFAMMNGDRTVGVLVAGAALLAVLCNRDLVGYKAYNYLLWGGAITAATLLLWLGCILVLIRHQQQANAKA